MSAVMIDVFVHDTLFYNKRGSSVRSWMSSDVSSVVSRDRSLSVKTHLVKFFPGCVLAQPHILFQIYLKLPQPKEIYEKSFFWFAGLHGLSMAKFVICAIYKHKFHIITWINLNPPFILLIHSIFIDLVHVVTHGFNRFVIISGYLHDKHCERQRFLWIHLFSQ